MSQCQSGNFFGYCHPQVHPLDSVWCEDPCSPHAWPLQLDPGKGYGSSHQSKNEASPECTAAWCWENWYCLHYAYQWWIRWKHNNSRSSQKSVPNTRAEGASGGTAGTSLTLAKSCSIPTPPSSFYPATKSSWLTGLRLCALRKLESIEFPDTIHKMSQLAEVSQRDGG